MGKYDQMSLDELEAELKKAKGYGLRILRKIGEKNTEEAAHIVLARARAAMKAKEVEATAEILAGMKAAGAKALLHMLRHGDGYYNGLYAAGEVVRRAGAEIVPETRRVALEIFAELEQRYAELDDWLTLVDGTDLRAHARERMVGGFGDFTSADEDATMELNAAFLAKAIAELNEDVRSWREAWSRFYMRNGSRFTSLRAMWECLQQNGALDDELRGARDGCRHPNASFLTDAP